jgi:hypothetical protein
VHAEGSPIAGELLLFASGAGGEDVLCTHHSLRDCREAKLWFTNYRLIFMTKVRTPHYTWAEVCSQRV